MHKFISKKLFVLYSYGILTAFLCFFKTGTVESYIMSGTLGVAILSYFYHQSKLDAGVIKIEATKKEGSDE
jgi:hypothetical protein